MKRREFLTTVLGIPALSLPALLLPKAACATATARLSQMEQRHHMLIGLAIVDTASGRRFNHRADVRFPLCSTFKLLLTAAVLHLVDRGRDHLDRRIVVSREDLLDYAPVTRHHLGASGMRLGDLCQAAMTLSDNTAANLLLDVVGGPSGLTGFARQLGDRITRLDRNEPDLNRVVAGELHDTTTPAAMLADLDALLLGGVLSAASRRQLVAWLRACSTGRDQIRASLPNGWAAGDKTGASGVANNDVAVIWPYQRPPVLVAAYTLGEPGDSALRKAALREAGHIAVKMARE